jgi:tight adherence protein B
MSDYQIYVIGAFATVGVFLLFALLRFFWERRTRRIQQRLQQTGLQDDPVILRRQQHRGVFARMDHAFDNLVQQTGLDLKPDQAIAWMILVGGVLGVAAYLVREQEWLAVIGFFLGAAGVLVTFFIYRSQYRNQLQEQLPDAIYLLSRSLRAGMSLEQALTLIGADGMEPLAGEFRRCDAQIKLGLPISVALENMARRLQTIDFNALVSTVTMFQATGGNLPLLLDRLAQSARDRASFRAYFRTATALSRVSVIPVAPSPSPSSRSPISPGNPATCNRS